MAKKKSVRTVRRTSRMFCLSNKRLIYAMAVIIVVLLLALICLFAVKPAFDNYVLQKQSEAQDMLLNALLSQLYQNGYIQIPLGDEVLVLYPYYPAEQTQAESDNAA